MSLSPREVLALARLEVYRIAPYYRRGILRMVPREAPGLNTFATSADWVFYWDPKKALTWGPKGSAAVLAHELWHLLQSHHERFDGPAVNRQLANIAMDLPINPSLEGMGFEVPPELVRPYMFDLPVQKTAEWYFEELKKRAKPIPNGVLLPCCGGCAGNPAPGEIPPGSAVGRTPAEIRQTQIEVASAAREHAKGRGHVPADFLRWADEVLAPPKVRWEEKLGRVARAMVANRPGGVSANYRRPARKQAALGWGPGIPILPSFRAVRPNVAVIVDTSGSMGKDKLTSALSETRGIFQATGAAVDFYACDAKVHAAKEVRSIEEVRGLLHGGGGSNLCPAFQKLGEKRPRPDIVVAATDGDITVPAEAPAGIQTIWLIIGEGNSAPCFWGTAIFVS